MIIRFTGRGFTHTEEFAVVTEYVGDSKFNKGDRYVYRVVSLTGGYLSGVTGKTVKEAIEKACGVEEVETELATITHKDKQMTVPLDEITNTLSMLIHSQS